MFTRENLKQYAVLKAMGATSKLLLAMVFVQTGALLGTGIGLGLCATIGQILAQTAEFPFRMMWFTPLLGGGMVVLVSVVAAAISARPVLRLEPGALAQMAAWTRRVLSRHLSKNHMRTTPACEGVEFGSGELVGCAVRRPWPLALMEFADRDPIKNSR
jgi:hypothetical protein